MRSLYSRTVLFRIVVVAIPTSLLGYLLATLGLGLAGFYVAGALSSPSVLWFLAADRAGQRGTPSDLG